MITKCLYDEKCICRDNIPQACEDCEVREYHDYSNAIAELKTNLGVTLDLTMTRCKITRREVLLIAAAYILEQAEIDNAKSESEV